MTYPVRPIIHRGELNSNPCVIIVNSEKQFYKSSSGTFETVDPSTDDTSQYDVYAIALPDVGAGSDDAPYARNPIANARNFSVPFPADIEPGVYHIRGFDCNTQTIAHRLSYFQTDFTFGRKVYGPDYLPSQGHYSTEQPPPGAFIDANLYATRAILGAWPFNDGPIPLNLLRKRGSPANYRGGFTITEQDGRRCAYITGAPDQSGAGQQLPVKPLSGRRAGTIIASIKPEAGETGPILCFDNLILSKTVTGYNLSLLDGYGTATENFDIAGVDAGWHRWALTWTGASKPVNHVSLVAPTMNLYCDGVLLSSSAPTLDSTVLYAGRTFNGNFYNYQTQTSTQVPPTCPAYHENYSAHNRAFSAQEIEDDFAQQYKWYLRIASYQAQQIARSR